MKNETAKRIAALRQLMAEKKLAAYIVPGTDPHASEYMAPHWQEMQWLSGFTGESGTAVVTADKALLWTDSRYYLQAEDELAGTGMELMRESDVDCPSIADWLTKTYAQSGVAVGVNPEMYSINSYNALKKQLGEGGVRLESHDLIAPLWTEGRPEMPLDKLYIYKECWSGESTESKLSRVRKVLDDRHCDAMVISALDEIGWLLNIRGTDIDYTPCVTGYCVVEKTRCTLFIDPRKTDADTSEALMQQGVSLRPYTDIRRYLQQIDAQTVMADGARVNEALYEAVMQRQDRTVRNVSPSPVQVMMSVKNEVEQEGTRRAMKRDAVALTRFFRWLETEAPDTPQTELTLAARLHELRAQGENFTDESFCTIAGWQGNGAIVHYHAEPDTCARIDGDGVLLLDSGGQYLDGTTDITRTVWVGDESNIPETVRRDFTLVLKGHIALARARFPKGTRGNQLDVLAHQFMWQEGITYGHGTGHGVGHFMGCHEGPANIRTDNNANPIRRGNMFSDEPGIYRAGEYGIRTENLVLTVPATKLSERTTGEEYYEFETLTLCFYDTRLIDAAMLTQEEKDWLNSYHERVLRETAPFLNNEEQEYLKTKCKKI